MVFAGVGSTFTIVLSIYYRPQNSSSLSCSREQESRVGFRMEIYNCKLDKGLSFQNNKYCGLNLQDIFLTSVWASYRLGMVF